MSDKKNTNKYMYQSGGKQMTSEEYTKRLGQITNSFTYSLGNRGIAVIAGTPINFPANDENVAVLTSLYNCLASYTVNLKDNVPVLTYAEIQTRIETAINSVKGAVDLTSGTTKANIMGANADTPINKKLKSAADAAAAAAAKP
jgi:hypothetical protein